MPGSGDNYDLLREYPEETLYGAPARRIEQGVYQLLTGQFYDIDLSLIHILAVGGLQRELYRGRSTAKGGEHR